MATAAGASSADSDTECSVCHELFKNPKLLPCAHVMCRHCLLQLREWRFHTNHWKDIVVSNDGLTAEILRGYSGIVVADQPMVPDVLYEVQLDEVNMDIYAHLPCGVVLTDPDHLHLPVTAYRGWGREAVVIGDAVYNRGHVEDNNLNDATLNLPEGSRVGVMVTTKAELHLWVNGSDRGVIATTVPTPCFAFFDLFAGYTKVSVLPPRHVD